MTLQRVSLTTLLCAWCALAAAQSPEFLGQQPALSLQPSTSLTSPVPPGENAMASEPSATSVAPREIDESVFGATLFRGRFAEQSFRGFNPDYLISVGDWIDLKLWGAVEALLRLSVDSQGNVFVPKLGPIKVVNIRSAELNSVITRRVQQIYRENVGVYASLANAEPVKVFVTGNVVEPGLYGAYASDSILHFLDRAGGIDTNTGSFLRIEVLRHGRMIRAVNLYDFLLRGQLPLLQFQDGDTVVVGGLLATAKVNGLVQKPLRFEFEKAIRLGELLEMAGVDERATHVQVIQHQTTKRQVAYLSLSESATPDFLVLSGDEVHVFQDRQVQTVIARVEGEFEGLSQYVMPYEANLADLVAQIQPTPLSNMGGIQIFRASIAKRQEEVLEQMLQKLEQAVLAARSGTREEAELRTREAELVLKFIDRARKIKPQGRLVLPQEIDLSTIDLQDKDLLKIPRRSNTVAVQGEVYFPTAFAWQDGLTVDDYLEQAGGMTQTGSKDKVFILRPNGEMELAKRGMFGGSEVQPGDEILVLPAVDTKAFQFSKDLVQIIYQLALSAGVVLAL